MPVFDSYEATRHINSIVPSLPLIGQTAHAMTEESEHCLAAGMVTHITKPVDQDYMVAVLLQYLSTAELQEDHAPPEMPRMNPSQAVDQTLHDSMPGIDADGVMQNLNCDWASFRKIL